MGSEVITEANDKRALPMMVETAEKNTGTEIKEVAADKGYSSYENYEYLKTWYKGIHTGSGMQ